MINLNNILIKIDSNLITFSHVIKKEEKNLNNTNIIDTKELLFSYDYIKDNLDLVSSFFKTIILKNNICKVRVNNIELVCLVLDLIHDSKTIKQMLIKEDKKINYDIFLKLLDNDTLEYLNCFDIPSFLLERLDINKHLKIDIRSEMFFISNFMNDNKLYKYSDIYYKKALVFTQNLDSKDIDDFKTFLKINKYLKSIHLKYYSNDLVYSIVEIFKEFNINNKNIIFYENNNIDIIVNSINYLKHIHGEFLNENKINFKVIYSKEYKRKNLFKQINFITLKYICLVIILCAIIFSGLDFYKNFIAEKKVDKINDQLTNILDNYYFVDENDTNIEEEVDVVEPENNTTNSKNSNIINSYNINYNQVFSELADINNDTVGWITVNNTKVNYPVVQSIDNDYYLKHDFHKQKNSYGWIYMDYRNNIFNLSNNTIILGHNLKNGMMFGTLRYVINESWYKNEENQIITFNTKVKNMKWKIFSIYRIPVTNDYMYANFANLDEFQSFIDTIKSRSIYDFNTEVTKEDHILTLSTCANGSSQRLVIHAVLLKDE